MFTHARRAGAWSLILGASLGFMTSCTDSGGHGRGKVHQNVVLLDALGQPIHAGSATPYSPRQTCGRCHDIDEIANGYHFQQGRTDLSGNVVTRNDYFADGRNFIRSAGMYGKW